MVQKNPGPVGTDEYHDAWQKASQMQCPPVIPPEPVFFNRLQFHDGKIYHGMLDVSLMLTPPVLTPCW